MTTGFHKILMVPGKSMAADITSPSIDLWAYESISIYNVWSGSPVGNVIIQVCFDEDTTWVNYDTTAAGGAAGSDIFEAHQWPPFTRMRVFYDFTSGTGTLTSRFVGAPVR